MSEEKIKPYTPYRDDQREGSNNFTANEGAGATQPYRPAGWAEWETQRKTQKGDE